MTRKDMRGSNLILAVCKSLHKQKVAGKAELQTSLKALNSQIPLAKMGTIIKMLKELKEDNVSPKREYQ
jgi:hypothetical protein